jgi:methyl-accepting chemotaxis protein
MVTQSEIARIRELVDEPGGSIPDKWQRLRRELPHLTAEEVAKVCLVIAEERHQEAAELEADAAAAKQVAEIIREVGAPNLGEALKTLSDRVAQGDARARELLRQYSEVAPMIGVSDHLLDLP